MKQLEWGETPWDNMSREQLLREVQRHHCALTEIASCLRFDRATFPNSEYWQPTGGGGSALGMADQIQEELRLEYGSAEPAYRTFFRYARSLMFPALTRHPWMICDKDGTMLSPGGPTCIDCGGPMRNITWDDLKPKPMREHDATCHTLCHWPECREDVHACWCDE